MLLPATWPPPADNETRLNAWIAQHGRKAYQAAVSGGQYQYSDGLFYGGSKPAWSNDVLRGVLHRVRLAAGAAGMDRYPHRSRTSRPR